jgi:hypothetical protein
MKKFSGKIFALLALIILFTNCNRHKDSKGNVIKPLEETKTVKLPVPDHIVIVVEENHSYSQIVESANAPYISSLSKDPYSASFINAFATTHPSQPNYLNLFSGSTQGVNNNYHSPHAPFTTPNLGSELIGAGKSFATYAEGLPIAGYNGDIRGEYVRKHNPATNWIGTGNNQIPATTLQPLSAFPADFSKLPTLSIIIPNDNNNMHDGSIRTADEWLKNNLNNYIQWAKTHNSLFILTFDEDDMRHGNHIVTIFTGAMIKSGHYSQKINHFNLLRTIEDMYNLPHAGYAASVKPIHNCWKY